MTTATIVPPANITDTAFEAGRQAALAGVPLYFRNPGSAEDWAYAAGHDTGRAQRAARPALLLVPGGVQ